LIDTFPNIVRCLTVTLYQCMQMIGNGIDIHRVRR
jgi:hypothetical protein